MNIKSAQEKETGRIEAFSDGVYAIAITLLILDIKVPTEAADNGELWQALIRQWPTYLALVSSFLTVLIMWINHHRLFTHIRRSDSILMMLNGLLLLGITVVPFPTKLVAEYVQRGGQNTAAMVYGGTFTVVAIFFNLLWRYGSHNNRLLDENADRAAVDAITRQYLFGPTVYFAATLLALISVPLSLIVYLLLALFFALPGSRQTQQ